MSYILCGKIFLNVSDNVYCINFGKNFSIEELNLGSFAIAGRFKYNTIKQLTTSSESFYD